jgi:hypothetical protein
LLRKLWRRNPGIARKGSFGRRPHRRLPPKEKSDAFSQKVTFFWKKLHCWRPKCRFYPNSNEIMGKNDDSRPKSDVSFQKVKFFFKKRSLGFKKWSLSLKKAKTEFFSLDLGRN